MKILLFRISNKFYKHSKNLLLLWKLYLLFSKYWKWFNFLLVLWVMPMDTRNIIELFNALLNESNESKESKSSTSHKLENLFYITVLGFIAVVIYYTFFTGGGESIDFGGPTKLSVNDDGAGILSLLDEKINSASTAEVAPPIISKHW